MALSYGGGAIFSMVGARIGDRIGHRNLALIGNILIPLLSLSALVANPAWAIGMLSGGWWSRNLRSPSRRVMLNQAVISDEYRVRVFGFLHALDVGGAAAAAVLVIAALKQGVPFKLLFLFTIIPLLISTFSLSLAKTGGPESDAPGVKAKQTGAKEDLSNSKSARYIFLATALYGFTFYSVGFPVLTVAQRTGSNGTGIFAFLVFQAVSAATGYFLARRFGTALFGRFLSLGLAGYLISAMGALVLVADLHFQLGALEYLLGMALLGFALGVIETLEPSLIAEISHASNVGRRFGALSSSRSIGLFCGNLIMGLLYELGPSWSYVYAAAMGTLAALLMIVAARSFRRGATSPVDGLLVPQD